MENGETKKEWIVNGFLFNNVDAYNDALQEKKGIQYLNRQTDLSDLKKVTKLYNELIEKDVFHTVVGLEYLKQLRTALLTNPLTDKNKLRPIPVTDETDKVNENKYILRKCEDKLKKAEADNDKIKKRRNTLAILVIVLVCLVGVMFYIANSSQNPNIINYEENIQNKYSSWAEELKEKENELRDWEEELESKQQIIESPSQN